MSVRKALHLIAAAVVAVVVIVPMATAAEAHEATMVTFTQSVEISGKVLPAGSYWFELVGDAFNRNLVRVYSEDRSTVYLTEITINTQHQERAADTNVTFAERGSSQPDALLEWRVAGETVGHEFQYSKSERQELALARNTTATAHHSGF